MATVEQLRQRMNNATQAQPVQTNINKINLGKQGDVSWWLGTDYNKNNFSSSVMNLKEIFKEKIQFLLFGKPAIIERNVEDEEQAESINKDVSKLVSNMKLQEILFANEGNVFEHGRGYVIIDQLSNGKVSLKLAEPSFPNTVTRLGTVAIAADVYVPFFFDKTKYYMRMQYTQDTIKTSVYQLKQGMQANARNIKQIDLGDINAKLPEQMQIQETRPNDYGFIPVTEITYKPVYDNSWTNKDTIAPFHKIKGIQRMLDEGTKALRKELFLNNTKILVDEDMLNAEDKQAMQEIADAGILGILKDSGGIDGEGKVVEMMQGNPKVTEYWENIKNIISIAAQALKLSELDLESSNSATGEIFNKGNDVETGNTLQVFRQESIAEIMEKAWAIYKGEKFNEDDMDISQWSIQLIPNVIMNESKMTDIVQKQLAMGVINMTQAVVKLEGISFSDAKAKLSNDDGIYNPALEAVASFTDNGEDVDNQTGNPQPEGGE